MQRLGISLRFQISGRLCLSRRKVKLPNLYNPAMNKRARKRLKEAIEKKNLERQKMLKEQSSASSQTKERRGFTVKPEKKRG